MSKTIRLMAAIAAVAATAALTAAPAAADPQCSLGNLACADGHITYRVSCGSTTWTRVCHVEWTGWSHVNAVAPGNGSAQFYVNGSGPKSDTCTHPAGGWCSMYTASVEDVSFPLGTTRTSCATLVTTEVTPLAVAQDPHSTCLTMQ